MSTSSTSISVQSTRSLDLVEYEAASETIDLKTEDYVTVTADYGKFIEILPQPRGYRIKARQYVGAIQLPDDLIIRVQPKIGIPNFLRLLNFVYSDLPILFDQTSHFEQVDELIEYLIRVFITKVEELHRKYYRRSYLAMSEDLTSLKGRLKIRETIRLAKSFKPKIFCEYDEFTGDIFINRIIKLAIFRLLSYKKATISHRLLHLYSLFDDVSLELIKPQQLDDVVYDRLTEPYRPLHNLCRLFIENVYLSHRLGERPMFCFLVDMERLFEEYVREVLKHFSNYRVLAQPVNKYLDDFKMVQVKPDIQMKKDNRDYLVIDCKYKRRAILADDDERLRIINSDIYQLLSYLTAYKLRNGVLVYPKGEITGDEEIRIRDNGNTYKIHLKSIDLSQTEDNYLRDFVSNIEDIAAS